VRRTARAAPLSLLAALALAAVTTPPATAQSPPALEPPKAALARLDSLQRMVQEEETRVQHASGVEANWDRLARAWFQVGDHARAAASLGRARALGGREEDTALLSGRVARSEGRFNEAIAALERAARLAPDDWQVHEDLGLAFYLAGRLPEAAEQWERAHAQPGTGSPARPGLLPAMRAAGPHAYAVSGRGRERLALIAGGGPGAMVISARLDGKGPYRLRIDTGSPEVVLGRSLARELGLATLAGGETGGFVGEVPVRFDYAVLDSLTLGTTTLARFPVAISDHPALASDAGIRGTLGLEALRRFRFCLDAPGGALWLEPLPAAADTGRAAKAAADTTRPAWAPDGAVTHRVPVLLRGTHLLVAYGHVNGGPDRPFLLDTGSPGIGLSAPMSTLAEAGITVDTTQTHTGTSAAGEVAFYRFPVGRLCVGGACRDSLAGVYGIFPPRLELNPNFRLAGIVSSGFLSRYRVGVDLSRGEVWLVEP